MSEATAEAAPTLEVLTDTEGKPTNVTLDIPTYINLLVRTNMTDPAFWPPQMRDGAKALARVRQIEADCIAEHGEFDWEKLAEDVQDEYDSLCCELNEMQDTGEWMSWEDYKRKRETEGI
jgi:hypothetical protein